MTIERNNTDERQARVDGMIAEFRAAQQRHVRRRVGSESGNGPAPAPGSDATAAEKLLPGVEYALTDESLP